MNPFIIIPTYNERENIKSLIEKIFACCPNCDVLVVDDDSPDGTWEIVKEMSRHNLHIHLLHRKTDRGRGTAGIAGFKYALEHDADVFIEMDADFSHDPQYLPLFLDAIKDYDVVLGSRFVEGGQDSDRGLMRRIVTAMANMYVRALFGIKLRDCSSGYRAFRRDVLERMGLDNMISVGPSIVQEILFRACQMKSRIVEIPIVFCDRKTGQTKLTYKHLIKGFLMVLRLRFGRRHKEK